MYGTMMDVYIAQERHADFRAEAEVRRNLLNGLQKPETQLLSKMWHQMASWQGMLRFGAERADLLQNSPQ